MHLDGSGNTSYKHLSPISDSCRPPGEHDIIQPSSGIAGWFMPSVTDFKEEKAELETILASGVFGRAPGLAQLLGYVCNKYFEGEASQVKEYNIAVEALGRPADFDQKRDSIVRVEAHRLRRRLALYYQGEGAPHGMRIELPPGQYVP